MQQPQTTDVDELKDFLMGLIAKSDNQTPNINKTVIVVGGAIMWRKHSSPFKAMTRDNDLKNVLWLQTKRQRFAVTFVQEQGVIEVREGGLQGNLLGTFDNATPNEHVYDVIVGL
jgi:hypothetical protein